MSKRPPPKTRIARHTADSIFVRDRNLVEDLILSGSLARSQHRSAKT